ncbi:hypothetical protein HDV02_001803 [Globomyces sp. JEL0801]|nr:hypothetical protein HDV02_001803 [Globomyces sp. JEL0801]
MSVYCNNGDFHYQIFNGSVCDSNSLIGGGASVLPGAGSLSNGNQIVQTINSTLIFSTGPMTQDQSNQTTIDIKNLTTIDRIPFPSPLPVLEKGNFGPCLQSEQKKFSANLVCQTTQNNTISFVVLGALIAISAILAYSVVSRNVIKNKNSCFILVISLCFGNSNERL